MKSMLFLSVLLIFCITRPASSQSGVQSEIEKANKAGKIVFLVVTNGNDNLANAMNIAQEAKKSFKKSSVINLDRKDNSNSPLVTKYKLSGAPLPIILVIATNGYVAGGATLQNLTADKLIKIVPTSKEERIIKSLNEGNSVFVVFTKKSDTKTKKQLEACRSACKNMNDKAETINVDVDDKAESKLVSKFNIDKSAGFPVTMVINAQGQVTSMLNGITESRDLISAATKKVSSGCCPPGSGKTCGPTK